MIYIYKINLLLRVNDLLVYGIFLLFVILFDIGINYRNIIEFIVIFEVFFHFENDKNACRDYISLIQNTTQYI